MRVARNIWDILKQGLFCLFVFRLKIPTNHICWNCACKPLNMRLFRVLFLRCGVKWSSDNILRADCEAVSAVLRLCAETKTASKVRSLEAGWVAKEPVWSTGGLYEALHGLVKPSPFLGSLPPSRFEAVR